MKPNEYIYLTIIFKAIVAVKNDNIKVTKTAKTLILFSSKISGEMKNLTIQLLVWTLIMIF